MNNNANQLRFKPQPLLVRRHTVYKLQQHQAPAQVNGNQQPAAQPAAAAIAAQPAAAAIAAQPAAARPNGKQLRAAYQPAVINPQPMASRTKERPGALRSQPLLPRPRISYKNYPTTPDHLDRIRSIRGRGRGKALVIVGNGPSINEMPLEDLCGYDRIDLMSINKPDPRLWPTKLWAFCDPSQYHRHEALWREYDGIILNSAAITQIKAGTVRITNLPGKGFSKDLEKGYNIGRSTVYANMQTAYWMDYDHVYAVGVDMNPEGVNGKLWFYGTNPDASAERRKDSFRLEAEYYAYAAENLSPEDRSRYTFISSYNPWPFTNRFGTGRWDHKDAVERILDAWG